MSLSTTGYDTTPRQCNSTPNVRTFAYCTATVHLLLTQLHDTDIISVTVHCAGNAHYGFCYITLHSGVHLTVYSLPYCILCLAIFLTI